MDQSGFTRAEWRHLRDLTSQAWERELGAELARLEEGFAAWRAGALSPHALSHQIHEFHQGPARDLYGIYTRVHPSELVARAVAAGVIREQEVPDELLTKLAQAITYYRTDWPAGREEDEAGPAS
jgi:hypothetical protein